MPISIDAVFRCNWCGALKKRCFAVKVKKSRYGDGTVNVSFASRPVPYREDCGGNGNGRRVVGCCCCCCWRFISIGFCFCNFCGVLKLLGTHSLELPFNPNGRAAMLMEVWPKGYESSITLRLAPPLRLEADQQCRRKYGSRKTKLAT
ncbi:hypothetical protein BDL97_11G032400 [Sphagnum fallax]|nr:hypothetical protein BDL97_11G032400 [Sphagnum fallax]